MSFELIQLDITDQVATVTINRPKALNALNPQVISELSQAFTQIKDTQGLRCCVLTGAGDRAFVAGADIKQFADMDEPTALEVAKTGQSMLRQMEELDIPVIAAVNGFALGGGFEIALACDFIVASKQSKFGLPEVGLGLMPGYGGTQRLQRVVGLSNARYITYTGEMFSAKTMRKMGAVSVVADNDEYQMELDKVVKSICSKGPIGVKLAKRALNEMEDAQLQSGCLVEAKYFSETFSTNDKNEGVAAFIEKRQANFQGN